MASPCAVFCFGRLISSCEPGITCWYSTRHSGIETQQEMPEGASINAVQQWLELNDLGEIFTWKSLFNASERPLGAGTS